MNIQPLEPADLKSIKELQPPDWGDIIPMQEYYLKTSFCHPIKITIDNEIAGIGTSIIHPETAWLAHIVVHPKHRNKGLGTTITKALIDKVKKTHLETICLLATDLGEPIYRKLGFEAEGEHLFFKRGIIPPVITTNIHPYDVKYKEQILLLDRDASGEDRAMRLEEHLEKTFIYSSNNIVEGVYFPGFGEGLIIANNPLAGIELMKLRLTKNAVPVLPKDNKKAIEFLHQHNFKEYRKAKRMWLGKKINWQPGKIYNRVSGQIG